MKPVESAQTTAPATVPILERLKAVDVSSLDQLLAIREEQQRIESYRRRAEELKDGVSGIVHARVLEDYSKRELDLRRRSVPLEQLARAEYRKLRDLLDEAAHNEEQATLEREELEFRHAVGELDESQTADRLKEPLAALERAATDRTALDQHATRFIQALGKEPLAADESGSIAPSQSEPYSSAALPVNEANAGAAKTGSSGTSPGLSLVGAAATHASSLGSDLTGLGAFSAEELFASEKTMLAADETRMVMPEDLLLNARPPSLDGGSMPAAALLLTELSASPREYRLLAINGIGRSPENQIQVVKPGISRMHAVVNLVNGGFSIKDLDSQNGTFVNGDRVNERLLLDGDLVDVGTVQFVFRLPWPSTGLPTAAKTATRTGQKR